MHFKRLIPRPDVNRSGYKCAKLNRQTFFDNITLSVKDRLSLLFPFQSTGFGGVYGLSNMWIG